MPFLQRQVDKCAEMMTASCKTVTDRSFANVHDRYGKKREKRREEGFHKKRRWVSRHQSKARPDLTHEIVSPSIAKMACFEIAQRIDHELGLWAQKHQCKVSGWRRYTAITKVRMAAF